AYSAAPDRPRRVTAWGGQESGSPARYIRCMRELAPADAHLIQQVLDGRWRDLRAQARTLADDPRFAVEFGEDTEAQRGRVLGRMRVLAETGHSKLGFPARYGGSNDVGGSITAFEMLAMGDLS